MCLLLLLCCGWCSKPDLRTERQKWDEAIELLKGQQEKVMKGFLSQAQDMEKSLKSLRERLNAFNQMYEDLITRKETKLYVETMNDKVRPPQGTRGLSAPTARGTGRGDSETLIDGRTLCRSTVSPGLFLGPISPASLSNLGCQPLVVCHVW